MAPDCLIVIDCGTTNSRVRVLRGDRLTGGATAAVGVVDTAKSGSNATLKQGLRRAFDQALGDAGISLAEVRQAVAFGMITSELGVVELPHLVAPVGLDDLAAAMHDMAAGDEFLPVPTTFIRGIKNQVEPAAGLSALPGMDFMRGEETQAAGLLAAHRPALPTTIVILSSHTKFVSVDEHGRILGSVTTLSGQLFAAICKETFLASAVRAELDDACPPGFFDAAIVEEGYRIVTAGGLNRALLMTRFMQVLMRTHWYERKLFLESLIAGEDLRCLRDFEALGFPTRTSLYLVGAPDRCAVFRHLIQRHRIFLGPVVELSDPQGIDRLGLSGALALIQRRTDASGPRA